MDEALWDVLEAIRADQAYYHLAMRQASHGARWGLGRPIQLWGYMPPGYLSEAATDLWNYDPPPDCPWPGDASDPEPTESGDPDPFTAWVPAQTQAIDPGPTEPEQLRMDSGPPRQLQDVPGP